jgi:hypothetical protein
MMPHLGRSVDDGNPSIGRPARWTPAWGPLSSSTTFEATNPGAINSGVRMVAQIVGAGAGPTARHLDHHRESASELYPCAQS